MQRRVSQVARAARTIVTAMAKAIVTATAKAHAMATAGMHGDDDKIVIMVYDHER